MSLAFPPPPPNPSSGQGPFKWTRTLDEGQSIIILPAPRPGYSWDIFALIVTAPARAWGQIELRTPEGQILQTFQISTYPTYKSQMYTQILTPVIPSLTTGLWTRWVGLGRIELEFSILERLLNPVALSSSAILDGDLESTNRLIQAQNAILQRLQELAQGVGWTPPAPASDIQVGRVVVRRGGGEPFFIGPIPQRQHGVSSVGVEIRLAPETSPTIPKGDSVPREDKRLKSFVKNMLEEES